MDDPLIVGVRFALYAVLLPLFGIPMFRLTTPQAPLPRRTLGAAAGFGILLSAFALVATVAAMAGTSITAIDTTLLSTVIAQSSLGWAWAVRIAALMAIALLVTRLQAAATAALAAIAVATLAWGGHGAAGDGDIGWLRMIADIVHLLAAGAWIGALAVLVTMVVRDDDQRRVQAALAGFSRTGTAIVATIAASGTVNVALLVDWRAATANPVDPYLVLLAIKIASFCGMLGLAALNRFRLTPALATRSSRSGLKVSLAVETAAAATILALVAWLGTLAPPGTG